MGWWGYGIMDGDQPCDCLCVMQRAVLGHLVDNDEDDFNFGRAMKSGEGVEAAHKAATSLNWGEDHFNMMALGHTVMTYGGPIDSFKHDLLAAIDFDDSDLGWCAPEARAQALAKFRQQVVEYKGTPIENTSVGLFETIFRG